MELHPFFTHFPIALLIFYALCELINAIIPKKEILIISLFLLVSGTIMLFPALLTGNLAEQKFMNSALASDINKIQAVALHENIATFTVVFFTVLFFSKLKLCVKIIKKDYNYTPTRFERILNATIAVTGTLLIACTGYYGGVLVYVNGIGVLQ